MTKYIVYKSYGDKSVEVEADQAVVEDHALWLYTNSPKKLVGYFDRLDYFLEKQGNF